MLFQVNDPAQFLARRRAVLHFVITQRQGFAEAIVFRKITGGALQIRDGVGALFPGVGPRQTHAVIGAIARVVRFATHGFGEPRSALRQFAGLLRGDRRCVEIPGIRRLLQG
ncbi:hypothetical protein D3C84_579430 [compost metagenome]